MQNISSDKTGAYARAEEGEMARKSGVRLAAAATLVILACLWIAPSTANAAELTAYRSKGSKATRKLMRGLVNTVFGLPCEIVSNVSKTWQTEDPLTGLTAGAYEGTKMGLKRVGIGVYETATFLAPTGHAYEPFLKDELPPV